jgi:hypothetical protein
MKKRTKAENAAHARAQRLKKKMGSVSPAAVAVSPKKNVSPARKKAQKKTSVIVVPRPPFPPPATFFPCPNCERLEREVARLLKRIDALEARPDARAEGKPMAKDDTEALRQRVIADKVERINNYSRGHVIGTART